MPSSSRPRVVVLTVHPPLIAATRLRAQQYAPAVAGAGLELHVWSFFRDGDIPAWFGRSQVRRIVVVLGALLRLPLVLRSLHGAAVVVVHREALPFGPPLLELLAARGRRMVWDVDDAIWRRFDSPTAGRVPQWLRATGDKYARLCRRADQVWAGSEVLAEWCRQHSTSVHVTPTVVHVPTHREGPGGEDVIWIGTHSTGPFVEQILPVVGSLQPTPRIRLVGARPASLPAGADAVPWSYAAEEAALARGRVGLYPIDVEHPLAEGKCGLKAILYMAHGIPVVVTPTKTNARIVEDGQQGLHARTPEEWRDAVRCLLEDDELWRRMSQAGHRRALERYSLQAWAPVVAGRLQALARGAVA